MFSMFNMNLPLLNQFKENKKKILDLVQIVYIQYESTFGKPHKHIF